MNFEVVIRCSAVALGVLLSEASALDSVSWAGKRGILAKEGFTTDTGRYLVHSDSGANQVTLTLSHASTSRNMFSYSKWEIDRWGDPEGIWAEPGAWQVVSNAANDVVFGIWGYWGWDGAAGSPHLVANDSTSYDLTLTFNRPVSELTIPLHGLNALFVPGSSNTTDELTAQAFLSETPLAAMSLGSLGQGLVRQGSGIAGNMSRPFGASQSYYDEGSMVLRSNEKLDRVVLRFTNRAFTPSPGNFANGQQAWSFSLGRLSFENETSTRAATAIEWLPKKWQRRPSFPKTVAFD